jgi:hypothetical protein
VDCRLLAYLEAMMPQYGSSHLLISSVSHHFMAQKRMVDMLLQKQRIVINIQVFAKVDDSDIYTAWLPDRKARDSG